MELTTHVAPGDFIDGSFVVPTSPDGELHVQSPADLADRVSEHPFKREHVDRAVDAARAAFPAWRRTPRAEREAILLRYKERLAAHADAITLAIARDVGKPLWEAKTEAGALVSKVDLSLGEGASYTADQRIEGLPGEIRHRPHGVLAVIGPFNFPAHLPNGQFVPALLLGNTIVFKPSEKAPSVAPLLARCFAEAGLPRGVFNVVQGDGPCAARLASHEGVDGVLFTGSVAVGKKIVAANVDRPDRIVALELGGKNASIVLADADIERAVREIAFSGFVTAGQRCTGSSRVYVDEKVVDAFASRLAEAARSAKVGYPLDPGTFMGPVIDGGSRERLFAAQRDALAAGFVALSPGGAVRVEGHEGYYVRPAVHRAPHADIVVPSYTEAELFAPDLAVFPVRDLDQAIERANATAFGLAAAIFTRSRDSFERAADLLRVGVLHWNRSSAGASGRLPFGGIKASGNHRPAGILAGTSCAYPLAVLLPPDKEPPLPTWPGLFG